ncbi:MAG TPA: CRISPR-associated protein Csx3 [Methanotrichaceae archaeon]|nr:CRISPR-associated protein Csx3 [Methanotrichaceae archaeon]
MSAFSACIFLLAEHIPPTSSLRYPRLARNSRRPHPHLALQHGPPPPAQLASRSHRFYDPRLGAVVVASHSPSWKVGDVIDINLDH